MNLIFVFLFSISSCDRDEKIRVTNYPNTYNILTYCLGHKEFISSIHLLDQETLISGSGDGKIIIWRFLNGEKLFSFDCDENKADNFLEMDKTENKSKFPIKSISIDNDVANAVAVSFYDQSFVYLFQLIRVSGKISSLQLVFKLTLETNPIWLQFDLVHCNFIWIFGGILDKSIELFELKQNKLESALCNLKIVETINESQQFKLAIENERKENSVNNLFKHYYQNVKLYYQRKQLRFENENKT